MANRKKRRPQQPRTATTEPPRESAVKAAAAKAEERKGSDKPVKNPWSRASVAILLVAAWAVNAVVNYLFYVNGNGYGWGSGLEAMLTPTPIAFLPAVLIFEAPIRLLRRERRMGAMEALATGSIMAVIIIFVGFKFVAGLNLPQVTPPSNPTPTGAAASPTTTANSTASPSASPSVAATPTATAVASPTAGARLDVAPTPVSGSAGPSLPVQSTTDLTIGIVSGDLVASILFVLVYPAAFRLIVAPSPRTAEAQRLRDKAKTPAGKR